jgi:hypothetical protein
VKLDGLNNRKKPAMARMAETEDWKLRTEVSANFWKEQWSDD